MVNPKIRGKMLEIVENQLNENFPVCTKETYERLMDAGYPAEDSKLKIAGILVEEMHDMMKNQLPFNEDRYAEKLAKLS